MRAVFGALNGTIHMIVGTPDGPPLAVVVIGTRAVVTPVVVSLGSIMVIASAKNHTGGSATFKSLWPSRAPPIHAIIAMVSAPEMNTECAVEKSAVHTRRTLLLTAHQYRRRGIAARVRRNRAIWTRPVQAA